ncbi:PAAR domain-containing protein [Enterobacter hormaechei]|uniref:PAAR domain-containing protein n=1 Tax=Enterobacter hormaechei TaxID=158836 RepID=UPI0019825389|nr:PAAR domain-containing protein [Enterobacter hormaechei]MBN4832549.1 PAAR domain-containing protein [Enterobacter hormaechei]
MSAGNYLVVGDKTLCGGVIVEGDVTQAIMGKAAAREGDKVTCGRYPGIFYISGGMANDIVNGRKMAGTLESRSTCSCQSAFIPSMLNDIYEN